MIINTHARQVQYLREGILLRCQAVSHARLASIVKNLHDRGTVDPASPATFAAGVLILAILRSL